VLRVWYGLIPASLGESLESPQCAGFAKISVPTYLKLRRFQFSLAEISGIFGKVLTILSLLEQDRFQRNFACRGEAVGL